MAKFGKEVGSASLGAMRKELAQSMTANTVLGSDSDENAAIKIA